MENRIKYLCVDGTHGYTIMEGSKAHEVEFEYRNGEISDLACSCFCGDHCGHQFAAMLQLHEILALLKKHYAEAYENAGYFSAVDNGTLFSFAVGGKETGTFILEK